MSDNMHDNPPEPNGAEPNGPEPTGAEPTGADVYDVFGKAQNAPAQVNAHQRRDIVTWVVVVVVLLGLVGAIAAFVVRQNAVDDVALPAPAHTSSATQGASDGSPGPTPPAAQVAAGDGGFGVGASGVVGAADLDPSHVRLDIYFDYLCPICAQFEQYRGAEIDALRTAGIADVYYHPISILDRYSQGTAYPTRAAAAGALIAQEAPDKFLAFTMAMFVNQPEENSTGLTNEQIQTIAKAVEVPADVVAKIPDLAYTSWVRSVTEKASIDGVGGTPTIALNGVIQDPRNNPDDLNWGEDGAITAAVNKAAGK